MLCALQSPGVQIAVNVLLEGDAKAYAIQSAAPGDVVIDRSKSRNEQNVCTHSCDIIVDLHLGCRASPGQPRAATLCGIRNAAEVASYPESQLMKAAIRHNSLRSHRPARVAYLGVESKALLPGTLDLLLLKAVSLEPMHGYGIAQRLRQISGDVFQI